LVEDEETLRLAVSKGLQKHGLSVLAAGDGRAAVELFRARSQDISAVLLDMTLPGMSGMEVFVEMKRIRADARVIFTSAYGRERLGITGGEERLPTEFIRKPYNLNALVQVLRAVLSDGGPPTERELKAASS
jgi:DNA-binding response OmpR family regulator